MAIDPRILLAGTNVPNVGQSLLQGLQLSQQIRRQPLLEEMDKLRLQQAQLKLQQAQETGGVAPQPLRSFAPVSGTGPEGQPALLVPTVDPTTGEALLQPAALPPGFGLQTGQREQAIQDQVRLAQERADIEVAKQRELAKIGVSEAEQKEQAKKVIGERSEIRKSIRQRATVSNDVIKTGNKFKKALNNIKTGRIAQARQSLGAFIPGIRDAKAEEFIALTNNFILEQAQKLTGVLSDTDIALLRSTGPQLGNTVEGNLRIIDNILEAANHARKEDRRFRQFVARGGQPEDFSYEQKDFFDAGDNQQPEAPRSINVGGKTFTIRRK